MLRTECYVYRCSEDHNITTIRTVNHTFPEFELFPHLAYVGGVTQFPPQRLGYFRDKNSTSYFEI